VLCYKEELTKAGNAVIKALFRLSGYSNHYHFSAYLRTLAAGQSAAANSSASAA